MSTTDGDVPADAFELFLAEGSRVRLRERTGEARIHLRSGQTLRGRLDRAERDSVDGHLHLVADSGRHLLVSAHAVAWIVGASTALRDESSSSAPQSLMSSLRESWATSGRLRMLLADGRWIAGNLALVAADHVELVVGGERWVVPYLAVEAWELPT